MTFQLVSCSEIADAKDQMLSDFKRSLNFSNAAQTVSYDPGDESSVSSDGDSLQVSSQFHVTLTPHVTSG